MVLNTRLKKGVDLHNELNRFWEVRGTGMETLEANLAHQLDVLYHEPLFQVFLYVRKAYDSLEREMCMDILKGYGMVPKMARLIGHYWDK